MTNESKGPVKFRSHPTALATLKPSLSIKHRAWGEAHYYRTNEVGVRDDAPLCGQPDVLLFGDSNLFASFLPFHKTLGEQLENRFDNSICSVNFGVPGYGPDQSLLRMVYEIEHLGLKPRVIVLHVFSDNDYGDLFRNYLFTVDTSGRLRTTGRDVTDFKLRTVERLQARFLLVRRLRDLAMSTGLYRVPTDEYIPADITYPKKPFRSVAEAWSYIASMERVTHEEFGNYTQGKHTTWLSDKYDFHIALNLESQAARQAGRLLSGIFDAANETGRTLNACLVVLIQPAEIDTAETGPISHIDLSQYSEARGRQNQSGNLTNIARRAAETAGVDYIDLFQLYAASDPPAHDSYTLDNGDNHWNATGVRIAAEALHRYIVENDCLGKEKGIP